MTLTELSDFIVAQSMAEARATVTMGYAEHDATLSHRQSELVDIGIAAGSQAVLRVLLELGMLTLDEGRYEAG